MLLPVSVPHSSGPHFTEWFLCCSWWQRCQTFKIPSEEKCSFHRLRKLRAQSMTVSRKLPTPPSPLYASCHHSYMLGHPMCGTSPPTFGSKIIMRGCFSGALRWPVLPLTGGRSSWSRVLSPLKPVICYLSISSITPQLDLHLRKYHTLFSSTHLEVRDHLCPDYWRKQEVFASLQPWYDQTSEERDSQGQVKVRDSDLWPPFTANLENLGEALLR